MTQSYTALVVGQNGQSTQATGPTWARLFKQRHEEYDAVLWQKLRLLHVGGFKIQKHAELFIDRAPQEPEQYYKWRLKTTAYVNHLAKIVGYIIGGLFGVPLKVSPPAEGDKEASTPDDAFYKLFATDCDLQGTDFSQFMRARIVDALVLKRALIGVDMPPGVVGAVNRAQEEAMGAGRAWVYDVPLEAMLDWKKDDRNDFEWCKIVKKVVDRTDPLGDHSGFFYEFKIWKMVADEAGEGRAAYEIYRTPTVTKEEELKDEDFVPRAQELTVTSFPQIPILEIDLPEAVWAGNQLGPLCTEHYNGRSDLRGSLCRNLVEIPYVKLGPEISAVHGDIPSVTQQDPSRGDNMIAKVRHNGFMKLGSEDEIGFAGPSGSAFQMGAEENGRVRDEIYGAMNTMALALANTASTVQRSGESKKEDRSATTVILSYLGSEARETSEMLYDILSAGRGDRAEWVASGADSFDEDDLEALIEEAMMLENIPIPSKTLQVERKTALGLAVARKSSQSAKAQIAKEIKEGMTDEMVLPPKPPLPAAGPGKGAPPGSKPVAKPPVKA